MENHVGGNAGVTSSSEAEKLPKEIQNVLPSDPFEILRISRALALQACAARIQGLQEDNTRIQSSSESTIKELQGKVISLQASLNEANEKLSKAEEEQEKLAEEKAALVAMVKKLNRDVAKLETFKRTLMAQLQDEGDDDKGTGISSSAKAAAAASAESESSDGGVSGAGAALRLAQASKKPGISLASGDSHREESESDSSSIKRNRFRTPSMTPSIFSPAYTPSATPPHTASAASPRVGSKSGRPRVDGKEFFRQARSRLSYEQFSTFLANIKELNAHKQTREETLKKAEEIFGADNKDLYTQFESLLSRHLPS